MIRLEGIRKSYRVGPVMVDVLNGVSLEVRAGDLLSVMGPSGCGKSTLMNIIGLLDRPTSGSYFLNGRDAAGMGDDEVSAVRNANIGFVFQSFHLLPRLTAAQNAGLPLIYRGEPEDRIRRQAVEALDRVGLADRAGHRPNQLSGGQQQRVAVARALIGSPSVILADEPTGALDPDTGREIMDMFERLSSEQQMAVVIVTHSPEVSERCRRRARVEDGLVREERADGAAAQQDGRSGGGRAFQG